MIKAVIFDIDGVLVDSYEANFQFYTKLFKTAGYTPPSKKDYPNLFHLTMKDLIKKITKLKSEEEVEKIWLMGKNVIEYPYNLLKTPKTLIKIIKSLNQSYELAIVSSRISTKLFDEIPSLLKVKKYFKVIVLYEDTKKHKPHPDPLILAAKKLKIKPEECVYIGDAETDMEAARAAGMKKIYYFNNFDRLPKLIESLK